MFFTEGEDLEYERMMRETPGHNRRIIKTPKERDCPHCFYYDKRLKGCPFDYCPVFADD